MTKPHFVDRQQNFWQLASIQASGISITGILLGGHLTKQYGAGQALIAVIIGNLILWIIGLIIIAMSAQGRKNAIENVNKYFGRGGGIMMSLILVVAFISWYMLEIQMTTAAISGYSQAYLQWSPSASVRIGVVLGLITALLSIGGIRLIKHLCVASFPILFLFTVYSIGIETKPVVWEGTWGISFPAITVVATLILPGTVNLPTFFRHSRSLADSFLALTLMYIFYTLFFSFSIFVGISDPAEIITKYAGNSMASAYVFFAFVFVILSMFCLNLQNIYFASAGWEMIFPQRSSQKEYAIVGLLGTAAYTFFQLTSPMIFIENLTDSFIITLGISLFIGFLVKVVLQRRMRFHERFINNTCWLFGCLIAGIALAYNPSSSIQAIALSVFGTIFLFICIFIIEETRWAVKRVVLKEGENNILSK